MDQKNFTIEDIETELGNSIFHTLKSEGWKVIAQYSPLAFDKGIDYDSYTLQKGQEELYFQWTNWFEWSISGSERVMTEIATRFSLTLKH